MVVTTPQANPKSRRCVFLDRDGVINVAPRRGEYVRTWEEFRLIPQIVDWGRILKACGFLLIVVTNQRAVARGLLSEQALAQIHEKMREELNRLGVLIDDVFCCPHDEGMCDCRKPLPGLITRAAQKWNIVVSESVLIGDTDTDRQLAAACGMTYIHVRNGDVLQVIPNGNVPG